MLRAFATRTEELTGLAGFLNGSLTLLLAAVEQLELGQGKAFLELDRTRNHRWTGTCVSVHGSAMPCAERAWQSSKA